MMTREEKMELIQRMLGLRHKIKVHDSMKSPETHAELSSSLLSRWELEDELRAIEMLLDEVRQENLTLKLKQIQEDYLSGKPKKPKKK
jgi:HD-like signal output (HDOD) protein